MRTNRELRRDARKAVRGKWTWRILCVFFVLQFIGHSAAMLLARFNRRAGVVSVSDFLQKKLAALQQGLDYALPTQDAYRQMWVATGFEYFVGLLFGAIALFGITAVVLHALKDEDKDWFSTGFGGFRHPLGVTALLLVQNLIVGFWTLFFVIPGIVAAYRYRAAWYLKCENPEWGALRCLGESARMMKGYKMRALAFDTVYFCWFFFLGVIAGIGYAISSRELAGVELIGAAAVSIAIVAAFYVMVLFVSGRAEFYRELKAEQKAEAKDDLPGND